MQANRSRDTGPELLLRRALHRRGYRYFVHRQPIDGLRRTADLLFPASKVAVFIDGCFWHGCPEHHTESRVNTKFWSEKVRGNRERDRDTDSRLQAAGWTVIRIWEHVPVEEAIQLVETALGNRHRVAAKE